MNECFLSSYKFSMHITWSEEVIWSSGQKSSNSCEWLGLTWTTKGNFGKTSFYCSQMSIWLRQSWELTLCECVIQFKSAPINYHLFTHWLSMSRKLWRITPGMLLKWCVFLFIKLVDESTKKTWTGCSSSKMYAYCTWHIFHWHDL